MAIDLSQLPAPTIIEALDYETILADMRAQLLALSPNLADAVGLESEPLVKLLQVCAYRELILRQRVNEAAKGVMLSFAEKEDLDQLAANYEVERHLLDPGDPNAIPPVPPTWESDESLRRRVQLSFEGFSTAGPSGAYVFHALAADARVEDASVVSPNPGEVLVSVLSREGDGTAPADLLAAVDAKLNADSIRPLTDQVTVQSATIVPYAIDATITLYPGPDEAVVLQAAIDAAEAYVARNRRIGRDVTLSGIYAALHQEGVQNVELTTPAATIAIADTEAAHCTGITVTVGGRDE